MNITHALAILRHPVLVSDPSMIEYLIGTRFEVGERFLGLLLQDHEAILIINRLFPYTNNELKLIQYSDHEDPILRLSQCIHSESLKVDPNLASGFLLRLMKYLPLCDYQLDTTLDQIRSIKQAQEIDFMRIASQLNDVVMMKVPSLLKIGVLEKEVAAKITLMFNEVSKGYSFSPIVAFGEHAADPHAMPGDRALQAGDAIVIDMGCKYNGYCSDMTRTFFIGHNPMKEVYDVVHKANLAAIAKVKPGVLLSEIDRAARTIITNAGYGAYFLHRTGHGIGMSVHEPFPVSAESEVFCKEGMIFSIEPGIYIENVGGVRIEDLVLVTKDGVEVLNAYPKNAEVI